MKRITLIVILVLELQHLYSQSILSMSIPYFGFGNSKTVGTNLQKGLNLNSKLELQVFGFGWHKRGKFAVELQLNMEYLKLNNELPNFKQLSDQGIDVDPENSWFPSSANGLQNANTHENDRFFGLASQPIVTFKVLKLLKYHHFDFGFGLSANYLTFTNASLRINVFDNKSRLWLVSNSIDLNNWYFTAPIEIGYYFSSNIRFSISGSYQLVFVDHSSSSIKRISGLTPTTEFRSGISGLTHLIGYSASLAFTLNLSDPKEKKAFTKSLRNIIYGF